MNGIYLGQYGDIELQRDSLNSFLGTQLDPSDVNTSLKRFSVKGASSALMTGDRIEIATVDKSNLELVSGHAHADGTWFVYVDPLGGLRLYTTFEASITGTVSGAVALVAPSAIQEITIKTVNSRYRHIANITNYEITTSRDSVDLTHLGDQFKRQYEAGLISGQGTIECLWEHNQAKVNEECGENGEFPFYLAQLVIRLTQGADFKSKFFIYKDNSSTSNSVWYEADCIITNVVVSVPATEQITSRIEFVTNGEIKLNTGATPSYLLQEDTYKILQEDGSPILLEQE
tara:strand:- start:2159 stop:3022 length:864 start_codon:yes stop_codon:yes gene_type:complete